MFFEVKYALVFVLFLRNICPFTVQPNGNVNCLRTRGEDMHNSVIVSCFTRDLQYCLNVEYKIKDKMQVGYNGTECPIKELCSNLEPILRHRHYYKEIRQPTCST